MNPIVGIRAMMLMPIISHGFCIIMTVLVGIHFQVQYVYF